MPPTPAESAAEFQKLLEVMEKVSKGIADLTTQQASRATAAATRETDLSNIITARLNKQAESVKEEFKIANNRAAQYEKAIELQKIQIELLEQQRKGQKEGAEVATETNTKLEKAKEILKDLTGEQKEFNEQGKQTAHWVDGLSGSLTQIAKGDFAGILKGIGSELGNLGGAALNKGLNRIVSKFQSMGPALQGATSGMTGASVSASGLSASLTALGGSAVATGGAILVVAAALAALAVAVGVSMKILELAVETENLNRELQKTTGVGPEFSGAILQAANDTRQFGVSLEDTVKATQALSKTFTDFTMMSGMAAAEITKTTSILTKLGISGDDIAQGLQNSTKALGQTGTQAAQTQLELEALSKDIGIDPAKMAADFAGVGSSLAKLGREGTQAFKELAVASKVTGIEVGRLLAITEKFDTFKGAAEQAGKLNAALGGNFVNAMELLTATNPVERFNMIRDAILDAGLSFDEMSYYQRKFYAEAAGMQDVGELALALSGDMSSLESQIGKNTADYEAAAKRAKDFQTVQESLTKALEALIPVMIPLSEKIGEFAKLFSDFVTEHKDEIQDFFKDMLAAVGMLAAGFVWLTWPVWAAVGAISALAAIVGKVVITFWSWVASITGLREALFVDSDSPTLFDGLIELGDKVLTKLKTSFDGLIGSITNVFSPLAKLRAEMAKLKADFFGDDDSLFNGAEMVKKSIVEMSTATLGSAAAPAKAFHSAVSSAVNNTTINNGSGGDANINIKFDNKKMAGLFDIEVVKSVSKMARNSLIG